MSTEKAPNILDRMASLIRTGPQAIALRFVDQFTRKMTGSPVWDLARITPQLYVGGQHYPSGWEEMNGEGITAIVNLREPHHCDITKGVGGAKHLHIATRDNTPPSLEDLDAAADFIHEEIEAGGKVYIHCGLGVGRAPTTAAAYFIKHQGMNTDAALKLIAEKRPFVHLTSSQKARLRSFEEMLHRPAADPIISAEDTVLEKI